MTTEIHKSIDAVDGCFLKSINPDSNLYFSKPLLRSFESSNPKIDMRYVCISKGGKGQAMALVQIVELSVDVILKNIKVSPLYRRILNLFFLKLIPNLFLKDHIKIMFCGNVFLSGEYCMSFAVDAKKEAAVRHIGIALDRISKSVKPLHAIFIKDFETKAMKYSKGFETYGFTDIVVEPNMLIALKPEWNTFEDYKNALKSKYRIKANKADSKSQDLEGRFMSKKDIEESQKFISKYYRQRQF